MHHVVIIVLIVMIHYNVDFVLCHTITFYTNSLSLRIHVNATKLPNVKCTLVATRHDIREFRVYHAPPDCMADTSNIIGVSS